MVYVDAENCLSNSLFLYWSEALFFLTHIHFRVDGFTRFCQIYQMLRFKKKMVVFKFSWFPPRLKLKPKMSRIKWQLLANLFRKFKHFRKSFVVHFRLFKSFCLIKHCVKSVQIRSFFWSAFPCIRIECKPEKTPYLDTFYAVILLNPWTYTLIE